MPKQDLMFEQHYKENLAALKAKGFDGVRADWKKGIRDVKAMDRYLAETALSEFAGSGNLNWLNDRLYDLQTDGRNYTRPAAYVKWAIEHQPVKYTVQGYKFEKDRERAFLLAFNADEGWKGLRDRLGQEWVAWVLASAHLEAFYLTAGQPMPYISPMEPWH